MNETNTSARFEKEFGVYREAVEKVHEAKKASDLPSRGGKKAPLLGFIDKLYREAVKKFDSLPIFLCALS